MYLPSNGAIANVVYRDLDQLFQGHIIRNDYIWNTVRVSEKGSLVTFIDVDIGQRIGPLRMLHY